MSYTSEEIRVTVSGKTITLFYIKPQSPKDIKLVNLTSNANKKGQKIKTAGYYGMNGGFFYSGGDGSGNEWNCLCNIAFQNGRAIGALGTGNANREKNGTCAICYNGSTVYYSSSATGVRKPGDGLIPEGNGTWAQGGMGLFLGYNDWEDRFKTQYDTAEEDYLEKANQRTAMVANVTTREVYLFACVNDYHVFQFRQAIMNYLKIAEGSWESTPWAGIMLDGGQSMQIRSDKFYKAPLFVRDVPQIISVT